MAEDKELMKKDLALILKLDTKLHYDNITEVKHVYQSLVDKKMFETSIGQRYVKKLESVIQGNDIDKCLFCSKQASTHSVICSDCFTKLRPTKENVVKYKAIQPKQNIVKEAPLPNESTETKANIQSEKQDKKISIVKLIVILIIAIMLISIGLDIIFTILMLVSLGVLIYNVIKKKPKKSAAVAFVILFVLAGVVGMFSNDDTKSADFAQNKVNVSTFLEKYEEIMIREANELTDEEFTVEFVLASNNENRKTYQIRILDVDCGSIQLVCDEEGTISTGVCGFSYRKDSLGAFLMITLMQTIHPDWSQEEAEALISSSTINDINDTYNINGSYAYAYFNDTDGLMLMISTKDNYIDAIK